jgi:hypothetical protein
MKRIVLTLAICLTAGCMNFAQQASLEAPASKDDVERYLEVTHFRDMMKQLVDVMSKQVHSDGARAISEAQRQASCGL